MEITCFHVDKSANTQQSVRVVKLLSKVKLLVTYLAVVSMQNINISKPN